MNMEVDVTGEIKRHNSFTSPNIKRPPVAKRLGRERCHSYTHTPDKKPTLQSRQSDSRLGVPKMSFRVVRSSKFRHVYGQALKREQCYDNIRVSKSSWDSTFCAVNPKFLAIIVESAGGGAFIVLPHNKVGRIPADHPLVGGHKGPVLDIAWCPHNDNVIASGSEDCVVKVWQIPDGGLSRTLTDPVVDLVYHQRRVGLVLWHPTAQNVLLTAGSDNQIAIWNVGTGEVLLSLDCHPDLIYSACWNWSGSKLLTTCRDKKIRYTRRSARDGDRHKQRSDVPALRPRYQPHLPLRQGRLRHPLLRGERLVSSGALVTEIDTSNGVMFPLYDPDTNLIYLCGKGDSVIRYFEVTPEPPFVHYINTFQTPDPQRGIGMMPKRGCDVATCEIAKFYRLNNSGLCQVVSMTVPRKSELFQEDLYPDTLSDEASLTADEWLAGEDAEPATMSLKERALVVQGGYVSGRAATQLHVTKKNALAAGKERSPTPASKQDQAATPPPATPVTQQIEKQLSDLVDEIRKLKSVIVKQENRIRALEAAAKAPPSPQPSPQPTPTPAPTPDNHHDDAMAPDEV
ncbi:coronin-6-like [Ostrinia furnacalis]|uniref:coronin-6-like n=1 Tax=Ostrinia furnacalis TaxID=93504 RepID=UPI00103E5493|nr:coronin-6-like [Ostrinia furnacalis]